MTIRYLHLLGSPVLREPSTAVAAVDDRVRDLVRDLFDTMRAAQGIGLAANQVGLAERVAVVEAGEGDSIVLINPEIVEREGKELGEEGCLSIPEIFGDVNRATRIVVETTDLEGQRVAIEATGLQARAAQHEIDHLDGILFLDHLSPLKRRMLLRKWRRMRKGETGHLKEVVPAPVED